MSELTTTAQPPLRSEFADDADFRELLDLFVSAVPDRMARAERAASRGCVEELGRQAHELKGAGGRLRVSTNQRGRGRTATRLPTAKRRPHRTRPERADQLAGPRRGLERCRSASHIARPRPAKFRAIHPSARRLTPGVQRPAAGLHSARRELVVGRGGGQFSPLQSLGSVTTIEIGRGLGLFPRAVTLPWRAILQPTERA